MPLAWSCWAPPPWQGEDGYEARNEILRNGEWRTEFTLHFKRLPAPAQP
ncbi:hypothetical protein ACFOLJ_21505 [Rugamonas sp. CCM 8940]|nr:hypothetical protein [Rugamonas sp. CCM 8940]MBJ7312015.1 hypothetical protein [Rugamonas sp. CCM 8940]